MVNYPTSSFQKLYKISELQAENIQMTLYLLFRSYQADFESEQLLQCL